MNGNKLFVLQAMLALFGVSLIMVGAGLYMMRNKTKNDYRAILGIGMVAVGVLALAGSLVVQLIFR